MKLQCYVVVYNRASYWTNRKPQRSLLSINRLSDDENIYIILQTLKNRQGIKYKINNNIENVFTSFINDGKASIRLKEPCHDLIIQSDTVHLKYFIRILRLAFFKKLSKLPQIIPDLNHSPNLSKSLMPNTKVVIKKNSEYPTLTGFPRITQELLLNGLNRKSFDRQILKLLNLRILNLSDNQITTLPKDLGLLPNLRELNMSKNLLGKSTLSRWTWLDQSIIKTNLCLLDISNNFLTILPNEIGKLKALVNLNISENMLIHLPQSIGALSKLKYLDVSKNSLPCLPGSVKNMKLSFIDISHNPFIRHSDESVINLGMPSLVEWSARQFLRTRKIYDMSLIPLTLVTYLDNAKYCYKCGSACFSYYIRKYMSINLNNVCEEIQMTQGGQMEFDCYFCSENCSKIISNILY